MKGLVFPATTTTHSAWIMPGHIISCPSAVLSAAANICDTAPSPSLPPLSPLKSPQKQQNFVPWSDKPSQNLSCQANYLIIILKSQHHWERGENYLKGYPLNFHRYLKSTFNEKKASLPFALNPSPFCTSMQYSESITTNEFRTMFFQIVISRPHFFLVSNRHSFVTQCCAWRGQKCKILWVSPLLYISASVVLWVKVALYD